MSTSIQPSKAKTIPFIRETPLVGSFFAFMRERMSFLDQLGQNDVCGFHMGPVAILFFNKAEHVQSILVEHGYGFSKGELMHKAVGNSNGLFVSEGDFHRRQRKLIAPMFQPHHIINYMDTIVEYGEQLVQTWSDQSVIDLNGQMINLTMGIIGKVLFDVDMLNETDELGAAIAIGFQHTVRKLSSPFMSPDKWPTPYNRRIHAAQNTLNDHIRRMIAERRQHPSERVDLLSVLLDAQDEDGNRMSEGQVIDECIIFLGAGHETTAAALSWTWYLLCQHPEIYKRVQQEVHRVLQGRRATLADLAQLPLCLQVFKETMRLYPPAPGIFRKALSDYVIDGYLVPKGANVLLSPYTLQRRPDYFPNPTIFDPERFTPEREKSLARYTYIPFGAGPRICIGNHFALMEAQLLIATLVQRATFQIVPGQHVEPDPVHNLALRPGGKVEVIVLHQSPE
jgi:cytochrome P450